MALLLTALYFSLRNPLLNRLIQRRCQAYQNNPSRPLVRVGSAGFRGLSRVVLNDVALAARDGSLKVDLGRCTVDLSFWRALLGQVRFQSVRLEDLRVQIVRPEGTETAPSGGARSPLPRRGSPEYGRRAARLLDLFFTGIPDSLVIDRLTLFSRIDRVNQTFHIPRILFQGLHFEAQVGVETSRERRLFLLAGDIVRRRGEVALRLVPLRKGSTLPFVDGQWGLRVGFDSLDFRLRREGLHGETLSLEGSLAVKGLTLNHPRLAREDVRFPDFAADYTVRIGPGELEFLPPTRVRVHRLNFQPTLRLQSWPARQLALTLRRVSFSADDFFSSLPSGLFRNLDGLQTRGTLTAALDFFVDFAHPESVRLEGLLDKGDFRIERLGRVNFRAVNGPFLYTAYEKDLAVRTFPVGPENPSFRPLEEISPLLRNAVLISEDGAFFRHRGILIDPFRESISANLRERRFVRGGSTISMQLVKNLYLKQYKTVARKVEEMIITWLIEENRLIPKERMYEIYLNIIEWGPGIYGAEEASRFYFNKGASELSLSEAIYLACIVPRPKKFFYLFDQEQHLRPWLQAYYRIISSKMVQRGMIDQQEQDLLVPGVRLTGPARLLLRGAEPPPEEPFDILDENEE